MVELGWLVGIIDGEGSFCAKQNSPHSLTFRMRIVATDLSMIAKVCQILEKQCIKYSLVSPHIRGNSTKTIYGVYVDNKDHILRLCQLILPYSVVKQAEIKCIIAYLEKAIGHYYSATEEDLQVALQLKQIRHANCLAGKPKLDNTIQYGNPELNSGNEPDKCVETRSFAPNNG